MPRDSQFAPQLHEWFAKLGSAVVAYSGGVDSALVAKVAHAVLGERALACLGVSPSYPQRERQAALALLKNIGARYREIPTDEWRDPAYLANADNRCYHCKRHLYGRLVALARAQGYAAVVDGANASDLHDHRPGRSAAAELGVRSPLVELGMDKTAVRQLARALHLPVWDKPAMACLSSRVPHGTPIDPAVLAQIESAEDALVALGFRQFRVRHHGALARIELPAADLDQALRHRALLVERLCAAGYRHVTLDLAGFRREDDLLVALTIDAAASEET